MKKIITIFFFLITPLQTNELNEFQIYGLSLGDNLLEKFSKVKILDAEKNKWHHHKKKNEDFYTILFLNDKINYNLEPYSGIKFKLKSKDINYIIYGIDGQILFDDIKSCLSEKESVEKDILKITNNKNLVRTNDKFSGFGETISYITEFIFEKGIIQTRCVDWDKKNKNVKKAWMPDLEISIVSNEYIKWYNSE